MSWKNCGCNVGEACEHAGEKTDKRDEPKRWFSLSVPDHLVRRMTREEYYKTRSWLRKTEREISTVFAYALIDMAVGRGKRY